MVSQAHTGAVTLIQRFGSALHEEPAFSCVVYRWCLFIGGAPGVDRSGDGQICRGGLPPEDSVSGWDYDVVFFVSDVWHRRMPTTEEDKGSFFLQVQYGRRDIAQRLQTTDRVNYLSAEAIGRARPIGRRQLWGCILQGFMMHKPRLQRLLPNPLLNNSWHFLH
jgi:hypothetical protein